MQCYENIDRPLPAPVRWLRSRVLRDAAFVAARSQTRRASSRARGERGARSSSPRPPVPGWASVPARRGASLHGRLCGAADREQGADRPARRGAASCEAPVELLLIGNGELRAQLEGQPMPGSAVRVLDGFSHDRWPAAYAQLDVLALPSHTTPTWKEQFGRVIIEALWCGVPVVGSDSGEIPWLIGLTGGGLDRSRGRRRGARRAAGRAARGAGAARAASRRPAARPSSGCSRCRRRPIRSSACCARQPPEASRAPPPGARTARGARRPCARGRTQSAARRAASPSRARSCGSPPSSRRRSAITSGSRVIRIAVARRPAISSRTPLTGVARIGRPLAAASKRHQRERLVAATAARTRRRAS